MAHWQLKMTSFEIFMSLKSMGQKYQNCSEVFLKQTFSNPSNLRYLKVECKIFESNQFGLN